MATNNPYSRSFKTKREEYEEKLKQRNENEEWIFGSSFGRPGAGAPLRDKNGNIISNLKTVTNNNLYKYDAQDFSKGDNNISVVNHKIYERNASNGNIDHVISDPFTPFRSYINQFDPNQANNINNNTNVANINNINNLNQNQMQIIQQNQLNNLNYLNNQNNQLTEEEQKRQLYLNQFKQNPYLVQTPYGLATQYPIALPYNLNTQNQNIIPNSANISSNNLLGNSNSNNAEYQRPFTSISQNANYNNNINYNTQNNDNELKYITGGSMSQTAKKYVRKLPESTIFSNLDQEKINKEKEKKLDDYKKQLEIQIMENKRKKAEEERKLKEKWKKEDLKIQKYQELLKSQSEQRNKDLSKNIKNQIEGSKSRDFFESSNDYEQINKSMHSQNNIKSNEMNSNQNNNINQNNIQIQENLNNNNYDNNFYNMDQYQSPEEQNFKNYINRQYHLLNDTINNDINNEMKRISEQVDKNYTPFTRKFLLMNTNSKTTAELSMENEKKLKKIQDLIEERKLVDYILGQRERPPTPKKEDQNQDNVELTVPSYFGINRDKPENRDLSLHSKSSFITKNDNIANFIASGRNQTEDVNRVGNNLLEKQDINNKFRDYMNDDLDEHLNYNKKLNTQKGTFGTNIKNDETLGGAVNLAKNLDNISTFIPLNSNREYINSKNDQKMKFVPGINNNFSNARDRDMDDLFKELDQICELTNNIDPTSNARVISNRLNDDLNKSQNKSQNNTIKEQSELLSNSNNNASQYDINSVNNKNSVNKDKVNEDKSLNSNSNNKVNSINNNNNNNLTNSQLSSKNSNLYSNNNNNNLNLNLNTNSNNDLYSNKEGNISSNNEKEEKELSNSQNFNDNLNNEEIKNDNINNEPLDNNNNTNLSNQNNMMNNEPNNNEVKNNNNPNEEEEEYEEEEVEVDEEEEDEGGNEEQ